MIKGGTALRTLFRVNNISRGRIKVHISRSHLITAIVCTTQRQKYVTVSSNRQYSRTTTLNSGAPSSFVDSPLDVVTYERVCAETLDTLCDYIEELTENAPHIVGSDVAYGDGVLTISLGKQHGTYVINRQTPNKQIWLSSPTSGPKRYDFVGPQTAETGRWVYRHTGESMHELLQREIGLILRKQELNFLQLPYSS